jgi:translocation and assembly module TamA
LELNLTSLRICLLMLALMVLTSGKTQAQVLEPASAITLSAPPELRDLLDAYFELPAAPLQDDTARAAFMRRAQREIGELLATEGYFTPTILLQPPGPDGARLMQVTPGPRTQVSSVNIEFTGDLSSDSPAHHIRMEQLRVAREDYAAAQITQSKAEVDPHSAQARLAIVIDSGPAFRFGDLIVSGLNHYGKDLVARQATFKTGDPYIRDRLLTFQTRLQNMPQFGSALVNIEPDVSTHKAAPVQVALTEAKSRRVAVGMGLSTNNGIRGEINYLDHNFLDRAWNLNTVLRLEQKRQTLSAGIDTLPDKDGYLLSWGVGSEATQIEGLKTRRDKLGVTRSRTLGQIETRVGINWQQESRLPAGGIAQNIQALVPDWQWHRRATDDQLYPREGSVTELRIGGGSRQLLSSQDFLRSYVREQMWWPVGERDVVSLRGEAGFTSALSRLGIPQEYLFRAGGTQSVRGYAYQSLGVREGAAVVGGRAMITTSLEYTHWFNHEWGAALFTDSGGVSDVLHTLRLSTGYGSGVRWRSPVGPLAIDLAWGQTSLQLHFSLAVAL